MTLNSRIVSLGAPVFLFGYAVWVTLSQYYGGAFGYHDLTLINEFLASTARGQGWFPVAQGNYSHFEVHFTPTLILLLPFYWLSDSQSLLLILNALSLTAAGVIYLRIVDALSRTPSGERFSSSALLALFLFFTMSRFAKNNLMAASCWFLYLPLAGMALLSLLRGKKLWITIGWSLLALGVRQDTGLFLSCQFLLVACLPSRFQTPKLRSQALGLAAFALAYTLFFALWLGPALGMASHVNRGWSRYGSSWGEIIRTALSSPVMVFQDLAHSAFFRLNVSVGLLTLLSPIAFLWANVPGGLLYLCDDPAKKYLWYYNSTFLLPGIFVAATLGALKLNAARAGKWFFWLATPALLLTLTDHDMLRMIPRWDFARTRPVREAVANSLAHCPDVKRIASDFRSMVFIPSHYPKYLLNKFSQADLVVFATDYEIGLPGQEQAGAEAALRTAGYTELQAPGGTLAFVKTPQLCEPGALK